MQKKVFFNWSGGKDSAFALYKLISDHNYCITGLLTTLSKEYKRISMHGVREELLEEQAKSIGIPLNKVYLPVNSGLEEYERLLELELFKIKESGIDIAAFGDIFLEDLKEYRIRQLAKLNILAIFPLWKINSLNLVHEFIDKGFKSVVVCVNNKYLDDSFVGRVIDKKFINDLPPDVDPCGENGEFHSFVFDGPIFNYPICYKIGEKTYRTYENTDDPHLKSGFWFCDILAD